MRDIIARYPNRADITMVGQVIEQSDGTTIVTGWGMTTNDNFSNPSYAISLKESTLGGWSVEDLRKIELEYRRGSSR